jgi:hypothetical protein
LEETRATHTHTHTHTQVSEVLEETRALTAKLSAERQQVMAKMNAALLQQELHAQVQYHNKMSTFKCPTKTQSLMNTALLQQELHAQVLH